MATSYLTPGVYVEEVPSANKPIEGVGTAVAAFVGLAPGGPVNKPMRISNWTRFANLFGDAQNPENGPFMQGAYLAHAVYGFFQNGGSLCWIVRVGTEGKATPARAALPAATDKSVEALRAVALEGITDKVTVDVSLDPTVGEVEGGGGGDPTYTLVVTAGKEREEYPSVSLKKGKGYVVTKINSASKLIKIEETGAPLPDIRMAPGNYSLSVPPAPASKIDSGQFEGDVATRTGMGGLAAVDEITMVLMPDIMNLNGDGAQMRDLQGKMIAHCENAGNRMTILDAPSDLLPQDVFDWRMNTAGYDSKMAALYYPWIEVMDPLTRKPITVPPSGHVAGVWCRVDASRGVHKAPANEVLLGVNGLAFQVTHAEQGALNQNGINCIRAFPGRGIRIWGARTLSSDPEWRYINVRRLFNFVSESVMGGTQWSVFEPNDPRLWGQLRIAVSSFLNLVWRSGALFGATPAEAYFVKCDAETNPPEVVEAGQVICEVGIAPVKPAEFVIFRLSQFTGGDGAAEVEE
jgi:phage tail sheath protein FI